MALYKTKMIEDITAFTSYVEDECDSEYVLFRGQRCDDPLIPRIGRLEFEKPLLDAERDMFNEFKRRVVPLLKSQPKTAWDWLALAQHHGMATRLLDWTLNPLAALWFCVSRPPAEDKKRQQKHGVVWVFFSKKSDITKPSTASDPFGASRTRVFQPKHVADRIVAQAGWFTVHKYMARQKRFIPLESNSAYARRLVKLRIPPDFFYSLRYHLDRFNINSSSLFPGIDGLCAHIKWKHSFLADEHEYV